MSFIQKILIPLSDQVDTSLVEHKNDFEGEGDRIALKQIDILLIYDDFNDDSLDPAKWNESDTGSNITETNSRLEHEGNNNWNSNGLVSVDCWDLVAGHEWRFTFSPYAISDTMYGPATLSNLTITENSAFLYPNQLGDFYAWINGAGTNTTYSYIPGKTYKCRIVYQGPGWKFYVQSDDDATYSTEVEIYSTVTDSTGPMYFHLNSLTTMAGKSWLDDVVIATEGYSDTSPSPAAVWSALPSGAVVDMSTAKCWMFKDGVIQEAGNTDVKFKYAVNNVALSSSITLAALRLESDPTITDAVNSFKAVGVYASDGSYESKSSAWLEVDVVFPEDAAGGGGLQLINGGIINV